MAATAADVGFGGAITFASSFLAKVLDAAWDGFQRGTVETTHMTSTNGYATFIPEDVKDPGALNVTLQFDKNAATKTNLADTALATITYTFPTPQGGSSGGSWACSGFLMSWSFTAAIRGLMTAKAGLKFSGEPTFTDGS